MTNQWSGRGRVAVRIKPPLADKDAASLDNRAGRRARARIQRKAQPPAAETAEREETDEPTDDSSAL